MRRVMRVLDQRTREFEGAPLFEFLRDKRIEPGKRLAFAPSVAHFVMTFADLYSFVLKEEPPRDKYQELVNAHTREDENHWRWFLDDLDKLGRDPRVTFTDALRFVWSERTVKTRLLSYHMCRLGFGADSLQRLVLVHCIEAAGKVTVRHVAAAGVEFAALTGKKLVYLGQHHSDTEGEHTIEAADVHRSIEDIALDVNRADALSAMVDDAFKYFFAFTEDMLESAKSNPPIGSAAG
jgi:hypothetical protein